MNSTLSNVIAFIVGFWVGVAFLYWWMITRPSKRETAELIKYLHDPAERRKEFERRAREEQRRKR